MAYRGDDVPQVEAFVGGAVLRAGGWSWKGIPALEAGALQSVEILGCAIERSPAHEGYA